MVAVAAGLAGELTPDLPEAGIRDLAGRGAGCGGIPAAFRSSSTIVPHSVATAEVNLCRAFVHRFTAR